MGYRPVSPSRRSRGWRQKPLWQCQWSVKCAEPRAGGGFYCTAHRLAFNRRQNKLRATRHRLGFCVDCLQRATPGSTRCTQHIRERRDSATVRRERKQKARGWKMVRVKL